MGFKYNDMVELTIKDIDKEISKKIDEASEEICGQLQDQGVNVINTKELIRMIQEKNKFIQKMFEQDFTESADILRRRMEGKKPRPKERIDSLSSNLLNERINEISEELLHVFGSTTEIATTILNRKMFLNDLLNSGKQQITEREMEK